MAATNLPELLDSALTRPGRFDRQVAVTLPDVRGRQEILDLYLAGKPVAPDVDTELLARRTPGFSGAELANLVNESALLAARHDSDAITTQVGKLVGALECL
jgi:ATP-dependent Zn protease